MFPGEGGGGHKAQVRKGQSPRETEDRPGMGFTETRGKNTGGKRLQGISTPRKKQVDLS